jgi:SAM-dependent methyltransferase
LLLPDHLRSQHTWDQVHHETTASDRPEDGVVAFVQHVRQRLPNGSAVLDAGCGQGRNTAYLAAQGFAVTACDVSPVALEKARMRLRQAGIAAGFQIADLARLPYADDLFAAAICVHVLPYHVAADIVSGVHELRRVLRPGGWLYFDLLDCSDVDYGCGRQLEPHTFLDPDGAPLHFSSRREIDELLRGFAPEPVSLLELKATTGDRVRMVWAVRAVKSF